MKFGTKLSQSLYPDWRFYYLDYDALKKQLKPAASHPSAFTPEHEAAFVEFLERELEKITSFRQIKSDELTRRVENCEASLNSILALQTHSPSLRATAAGPSTSAKPAGGQAEPLRPPPEPSSLSRLEEEISRITAEVTELSKYTRLNYSGFIKIIKKHDKHTRFALQQSFMGRLNTAALYKESFDKLIIKLSKLFEIVRSGGRFKKEGAPTSVSGTSFVRKTTKYWVHPDNVTEVKCIILKNLPVLVFTAKDGKEPDPAITSIYYDNDSFELYLGRLEKTEKAQALRLRWYGNTETNEIFVERKMHHEDWTGEISVKDRFPIKEKYVNDFLSGAYSVEKITQKMRERQLKSKEEIEHIESLAREVQQSVREKRLHPMMRTFYNRTAFQLPGDARVRISLDTELTMIREDNFGRPRAGSNWRRMDVGTTAPFDYLQKEDVHAFPYAVLEVKLQTQHGTAAPAWVDELVHGHLVEEVPKFSKFIHGCATLLYDRVNLLPFWLPQMDKDIRKPAPQRTSRILSANDGENVIVKVDEEEHDSADENSPLISKKKDKGKKSVSIFSQFGRGAPSGSSRPASSRAAPKRIALPVRVEPKVFFANERTFLSWLHFCIVLGGLALGLLNFGDRVGQISGLIFTIVAMLFMIYALFLYQWRAHKIRNRDPAPYDDRVGPTVLVVVLFFAVLTNFWLKFSSHSAI